MTLDKKEEYYRITILAPKRFEEITEDILNDIANSLFCYPNEIRIGIELLQEYKEHFQFIKEKK